MHHPNLTSNMKTKLLKTSLLVTLLFFVINKGYSQYGIEVNYGLSGVFQPSSNQFTHIGAGVFYDFNESYGLKLDFGSDKFRINNELLNEETGVDVTRISLQGTANLSSLFSRSSSYDTFSIVAHAGAGYSTVKSTFGGKNDNIVNLVGGITPRIRIADGLYFAIDTAIIVNVSQHYNFDGSLSYTDAVNSFTGLTYNVTGGIIYKFNEY